MLRKEKQNILQLKIMQCVRLSYKIKWTESLQGTVNCILHLQPLTLNYKLAVSLLRHFALLQFGLACAIMYCLSSHAERMKIIHLLRRKFASSFDPDAHTLFII